MFFKKDNKPKKAEEKYSHLRMYPENINTVNMLPSELLTPLAVKYINKTLISGGAIVTLRNGFEPLSLAIMEYVDNNLSLDQIVTMPQHRGKGYAGELLHRLLAVSDKSKSVSANLNTGFESYPFVKKILLKEGFEYRATYTTFIASMDDMLKDGGKENLEQVQRLRSRILDDGFKLLSFSEASSEMLGQVIDSGSNYFKNILNPKPLFSVPGYIIKDYSFILEKDGEIAAYSILSERNADTVEFDQLAASEKYRNSGLAILSAVSSFDKVQSDGRYKNFIWQVMDGNYDCSDTVSQMFPCKKTEMRIDMFYLPAQKTDNT